jgi:NAD(P)-dependent dehydrogenase (short-subunit alcohol dehydrogenase family)
MQLTLVIGASAGIGRAFVEVARSEGAVVATVSRGATAGDHALRIDLADPPSWLTVADWFESLVSAERWDRVDVLHAAATLEPIGPAGHVDAAAYQRNVLLNSAAPQVLGAASVGILNRHGRTGCLMMLSSGAARTAYEGWSSYGAGKAAMDQWVRAVGAEQSRRPAPVVVLSVAPGVVATAMQEQIRATTPARFPRVDRFRRLHEEGELASTDAVARRLWDLMHDPAAVNGDVIDLRTR